MLDKKCHVYESYEDKTGKNKKILWWKLSQVTVNRKFDDSEKNIFWSKILDTVLNVRSVL